MDRAQDEVISGNIFQTSAAHMTENVEEGLVNKKKTMKLHDNSECMAYTLAAGFAHKPAGNNAGLLYVAQLRFVLFVQGLGDKTLRGAGVCNKIIPRGAEKAMQLFGTAEGQAIFPEEELMRPSANGKRTFRTVELLSAQKF